MNSYEVYCYCRFLMHRNKPSITTFELSKECGYYNLLTDHLIRKLGLDPKEIKDYIRCNYNENPDMFDPYKLINNECYDLYLNWKKTESSVSLYFTQVLNGIIFIENFCMQKDLIFSDYCDKYMYKHIRERKFDWVIPVSLKIIDRKTLKSVDKILLKNFLDQYNTLEQRLKYNPELNLLIEKRIDKMKELLTYNKLQSSL